MVLFPFPFSRFFKIYKHYPVERLYLHQTTETESDKFSYLTFYFGFLDHKNLYFSNVVRFHRGNVRIIQGQEKDHVKTG